MVRWIFVALVMSIVLTPDILAARKKRFIVHYKTQKLTVSGAQVISTERVIYNADSASEARSRFPLGSSKIESVEEDIILQAVKEPGDIGVEDSLYQSQWSLFNANGGIELPMAWDISTGSPNIVVAVVDTGITNHVDLQGKILNGADLISDPAMANDGGGRDADANDAGDWVTSGDSCYRGSNQNSTWHGTHVAGTIAANSANGLGVTGVAWGVKILPVRVLGKCGGYLSDIADGIRWAAGGSVAGVPNNPNPADVINLSLGGFGTCGTTMQNAIDFAVAQGAVVVVAAGNDNQNLNFTPYVPATCKKVITVGAGNRNAFKSFYSNYGDFIDIMAPGGDFDGRIISTVNMGTTTQTSDGYEGMIGTSMAAPHVAGVAALIKSVKPGLFPAQIEDILKRSKKFFNCTSGCGEGLVDAFEALKLAEAMPPDATFEFDEALSRFPSSDSSQNLEVYEEDDGGMCGSVAFVDGSPPKGGMGSFYLSLILGIFLSALGFQTRKGKRFRL